MEKNKKEKKKEKRGIEGERWWNKGRENENQKYPGHIMSLFKVITWH